MNFIRQNFKWLLAPFLMCVASGFGQTFFIALFGDAIRAELSLSHGAWGGIYATGTLASAIAMIRYGEWADHIAPQKLTTAILIGFCIFATLMALNPFLWALPIIIFGLRFCGQGMLTHISQVITARWFSKNRATAMASTSLGVGFAEALFPASFVFIIIYFGWRNAWVIAALLLVALIFAIRPLLAEKRIPSNDFKNTAQFGRLNKNWTRKDMLNDWAFWVAIPAIIAMPFLTTTFFFQIPVLAFTKDWTLAQTAVLIPISTLAALFGLMGGGVIVDKIGLHKTLPFIFIPCIFGFFWIALIDNIMLLPIGLALTGLSQGFNAATGGVFWPEFYGTKHLGAIRAIGSAVMVFATAIGPLLSGYGLDLGISYNSQLIFMSIYAMIATLLITIVILGTKADFQDQSN